VSSTDDKKHTALVTAPVGALTTEQIRYTPEALYAEQRALDPDDPGDERKAVVLLRQMLPIDVEPAKALFRRLQGGEAAPAALTRSLDADDDERALQRQPVPDLAGVNVDDVTVDQLLPLTADFVARKRAQDAFNQWSMLYFLPVMLLMQSSIPTWMAVICCAPLLIPVLSVGMPSRRLRRHLERAGMAPHDAAEAVARIERHRKEMKDDLGFTSARGVALLVTDQGRQAPKPSSDAARRAID
jgi:hypothetical protein